MLCESKTGYLLNFIIYTGATTEYLDQPDPLLMKFYECKSPSKLFFPCFKRDIKKSLHEDPSDSE